MMKTDQIHSILMAQGLTTWRSVASRDAGHLSLLTLMAAGSLH
jgi:hypothetical protein